MSAPNDSTSDITPTIIRYIEEISDQRSTKSLNYQHPLSSVIFIALVAGLCGANTWTAVHTIAVGMKEWIAQYVSLPNGIPSHDTFGRVFSILCPNEFNNFLIKWSSLLRSKYGEKEVVSFDGKTLRGTAEKSLGIKGMHILNAWSSDNGICLGQIKVDDKSNEITAMPKLIKLLDLKDCIITSDALNTQKKIAEEIIDAGGDYALPVKENHPQLLEDIKLFFQDALDKDFRGIDGDQHETFDKQNHGRVEKRSYYVMDGEDLPDRALWKGLKSIGMVIRERMFRGKIEKETAYFILSFEMDAKLFAKACRNHWGIENLLHGHLDVTLKEDESRYRDRIGAQNLAIIRKTTLAMLSKDTSEKCSLTNKRLLAAVSPEFRKRLLKNFI